MNASRAIQRVSGGNHQRFPTFITAAAKLIEVSNASWPAPPPTERTNLPRNLIFIIAASAAVAVAATAPWRSKRSVLSRLIGKCNALHCANCEQRRRRHLPVSFTNAVCSSVSCHRARRRHRSPGIDGSPLLRCLPLTGSFKWFGVCRGNATKNVLSNCGK